LRSGRDHCDCELAVEARREAEEGGRKAEGGTADIKSNNPHLAGGGKMGVMQQNEHRYVATHDKNKVYITRVRVSLPFSTLAFTNQKGDW
jgi:hypothetical protein